MRNVRYAADIDDGAVVRRRVKQPLVERRYQWRALTAGGDVAGAKVGDGSDPGVLRDHRGIADLQGERVLAARAVSHGLPVAADGANVPRWQRGFPEHLKRRAREQRAQFHVECAECIEPVVSGAHERMNTLARSSWKRFAMGGEQGKFFTGANRNDDRVYSIHTGTGHATDVVHRIAVSGWLGACARR